MADDIKAQIGGLAVGERLIQSLLERYEIENLRTQIELLFNSTEQMVRSEIIRIPDGSYDMRVKAGCIATDFTKDPDLKSRLPLPLPSTTMKSLLIRLVPTARRKDLPMRR